MRYILTFDGRVIAYDENADDIDKPAIRNSKDNVIREVGSIEELVDVVTLMDTTKSRQRILCDFFRKDYTISTAGLKPHQRIMGAAWTRNGLTYVAVLNNEGKFELL